MYLKRFRHRHWAIQPRLQDVAEEKRKAEWNPRKDDMREPEMLDKKDDIPGKPSSSK